MTPRLLNGERASHPRKARDWISHRISPAAIAMIVTMVACSEDVTGPVDPVDPLDPPAVATVDVVPLGGTTLFPGDTVRLGATPRAANGLPLNGRTVQWTSSDTLVAMVSATGLVTARSVGEVKIRATVEGRWGEAALEINQRDEGEQPNPRPVLTGLSPTSVPAGTPVVTIVLTGADFAPSAEVLWNGASRPSEWIGPNEMRLTVAGSHLLTEGIVQIAVRNSAPGGGDSEVLPFQIGPVAVDRVTVTPSVASVPAGREIQLTAAAYAADGSVLTGRTFSWNTSASGTATVDANGIVTGRDVGEVLITVASEGRTASARISVLPAVHFVTVNPNPAAVLVNSTVQLEARTYSSSALLLTGRTVTWSSENPAIATVDQGGVVTGVSKGTTRIRAESEGVVGWGSVEVRQYASGPVQAYEWRGPYGGGYMPSVGTTTWTDEQGVSHQASLYIGEGTLTIDSQVNRFDQVFHLDVVVLGVGTVGQEIWVDEGTYMYTFEGRLVFTSTDSGATFTATPSGLGELAVEQRIGTAPTLFHRWVIE